MKIPDKYAFWRWPAKIRSLSAELEQLKREHARVLAGQSKLLEWVKVTHRLTSPAQGIRALLQNGKRLVPVLVLLLGLQSISAQPAPPILRQPLTTNSHFGPTPTEGQVPIWNATVKKWSNNVVAGGASMPHTWTNDNGTLKPIAFPTNILLRVNVPDDGVGTNFYFDSRVNRTNAASKLFEIYNGGSNALTIGPDGGLFSGRGNTGPFPGGVLYGIFDTALGETNQQEIFTLSGNSVVGYSGASDLIIDTNYGALILFANKEGGVKFTRFSVQAGAGDNPQDFNSFTMQALVDGATYMQMDPNFSLLTRTNYLFSSSIRITNTDMLLSLQNSNFPVLEVDGVGDLRLIKKIPYLWPSSQGAAGTALTNNGSGALGWWPVSAGSGSAGLTTNANQFLGVPLSIKDGAFLTNINVQSSLEVSNGWIYASGPVTNGTQLNLPHLTVSRSAVINAEGDVTNSSADSNWSLYPTNVWNDRQFGSQNLTNWSNIPTGAMANVASTTFLTNWANAISNLAETKQLGSANLTNWSNIPTGAMANVVSTTFLTNWANAISNLAETKQLGSAVLTNLVGTVANNVTNVISLSTTNATSKPLTNSYTSGVLTIFGIEQGSGQAITMNASNIIIANDWAQTASTTNVVGVSNWVNSVSNLVQTKQNGSAVLTNLVSTVANNVTNVVSLSTTNATSKPLTNAYANGVLTLFGIEQGSGLAVTMSSNIVIANDWAQTASTTNVVGVSNWVNSVSNYVTSATNSASVTNWIVFRQPASLFLTNLSGTGAVTNLFTLSLSNATIKPLVIGVGDAAGATNTTGQIRGLEAGSNITLTDNGSNYVIDATSGGGGLTTNANQFLGVPLSIKSGALLTNTVLRNVTNTIRVNIAQGVGIFWPVMSFEESTPGGNLLLLNNGSLSVQDSVTVGTNLYLQGGVGSVGQVWTLTNASQGTGTWSNAPAAGSVAFSDLVWTNDTVAIKPIAFPTNVILRVDVPDDGVGTNFYWDTMTYRTNSASKLLVINDGGSNALTVGAFGGIFVGRNNGTPDNSYVFRALRDTAIGEPNQAYINWSVNRSTVGYLGAGTFGAETNLSTVSISTFDGSSKQSFFNVNSYGYTNTVLQLIAQDPIISNGRGVVLSPGYGGTPTNYLFNSALGLTNIHTLFSLQNSNTPVFEVNGIGDLKLLKRVAYSWPSAQGAAKTVLTNDGSGNLGWGTGPVLTTNGNQFLGSPLAIKDGALLTNVVVYPTGNGTAPALTVTNVPGIGTNSFQVLNTNGVPVIYGLTNNGITLVASNVNLLGPQTNTSSLNVLGGVTNWAGVETRGNATNAGWLAIAGGFTNLGGSLLTGSVTNGGRVDTAGGVTNWIGSETKGTLYASSNLLVKAGQSVSNAWVGGLIYWSTTSFTNLNALATMSNLANVLIPAHVLTNNGDTIHAVWGGIMPNALINTNEFQIVFGSQTILDTGLQIGSNTAFRAEAWITRTGNTAQHAEGRFEWGPGGAVPFAFTNANLELAQTNGIDTSLALKGGARRGGAHTNNSFRVYYDPAAR